MNMNLDIIATKLELDIYGFGGVAPGDPVATVFKLSGKMWEVVKSNNLKNKGKNIWVYGPDHSVFAGVELVNPSGNNHGLEKMTIVLKQYAYGKHTGSYNLIKQTGKRMKEELAKQSRQVILPYIEIYGHWNKDESKLETELIMNLNSKG